MRSKSADVFEKASAVALRAHRGMQRKGGSPYILHPMEVAAIASTMSSDREVLAAAILHDVVEDTAFTIEDVEERFGARVAALVSAETEDKMPGIAPEASWQMRKEASLRVLTETADVSVKILWLSDKLSNMRSFKRLRVEQGSGFWSAFHQKDPSMQKWYYQRIAELTSELSSCAAWKEYTALCSEVFKGVD